MKDELQYLPVNAQERALVKWFRGSRYKDHFGDLRPLLLELEKSSPTVDVLIRALAQAQRKDGIAVLLENEKTAWMAEVRQLLEQRASTKVMSPQAPVEALLDGLRHDIETARAEQREVLEQLRRALSSLTARVQRLEGSVQTTQVPPLPADSPPVTPVEVKPLEDAPDPSNAIEMEAFGEAVRGDNVPAFFTSLVASLLRRQLVPAGLLPFGDGRVRFIAAADPVHRNGERFTRPVGEPGFYLEAHCSRTAAPKRAQQLLDEIERLLELARQNAPAPTAVQIASPEPSVSPTRVPGAGPLFLCRYKGLEARGYPSTEGFVVLKGSQAALDDKPSLLNTTTGLRALRPELIADQTLVVDGGCYRFTHDQAFHSPSAAALVVCGFPVAGPTYWKTPEGIPMKDALKGSS